MDESAEATLSSTTGDCVSVTAPGERVATNFPVAVYELADGRRVVVVSEGGPVPGPRVDGRDLVVAAHSRWPDAIILERRARDDGHAADPRGYDVYFIEVTPDGDRVMPDLAGLADAGLRLSGGRGATDDEHAS
jgi:hypothetical protein